MALVLASYFENITLVSAHFNYTATTTPHKRTILIMSALII